ncbi:GGDEF domain-containing protein [Aestuariicella hydrocarbonica]|uniref:diguanylate cyclase n=1 Tax=Pseudomaricurvus hydrocarbonicus TaxID=1470433 RepID=A0A9E5MM77_9GAMM|nr:GGDEF domain-containing protein [Aestuariicella hydrocarbonica]NHO66518.1 GGDEF domain-containing protein [Aestuariicella hydrocarbonica]
MNVSKHARRLNGWDTLSLYAAIVTSFSLTLSRIMLNNARIHQQLALLASRDSLTGALNRRAFYEKSDALLAKLKRNVAEVSVCLIDLDHFTRIHDTYGHTAIRLGDEVLKQFSNMVQSVIRSDDLFGRYGGEEFVLLLNNSNLQDAQRVIERLRSRCESEGVQLDQQRLAMTFSAGLSHTRGPVETTLTRLLHTADQCLYAAKAAGRNQFIAQSEALPA